MYILHSISGLFHSHVHKWLMLGGTLHASERLPRHYSGKTSTHKGVECELCDFLHYLDIIFTLPFQGNAALCPKNKKQNNCLKYTRSTLKNKYRTRLNCWEDLVIKLDSAIRGNTWLLLVMAVHIGIVHLRCNHAGANRSLKHIMFTIIIIFFILVYLHSILYYDYFTICYTIWYSMSIVTRISYVIAFVLQIQRTRTQVTALMI